MVVAAPAYCLRDLLEDAARIGELALLEQDLERVTLRDVLRDDQVRDVLQWWPVDQILVAAGEKNGLQDRVRSVQANSAIPVSKGGLCVVRPGLSVYDDYVYCTRCKLLFRRGIRVCPKCHARLRTRKRG